MPHLLAHTCPDGACGDSDANDLNADDNNTKNAKPNSLSGPVSKGKYIGFESAPVRPIATNAKGNLLFVTNISNNRLEVFNLDSQGDPIFKEIVDVGLEPVAVATDSQYAWVINHLSDSISIIDINTSPMWVVKTLLVGDEPKDIILANGKAFITTAYRGQQRLSPYLKDVHGAGPEQLHSSGVGSADIWNLLN